MLGSVAGERQLLHANGKVETMPLKKIGSKNNTAAIILLQHDRISRHVEFGTGGRRTIGPCKIRSWGGAKDKPRHMTVVDLRSIDIDVGYLPIVTRRGTIRGRKEVA